MYGDGREERMDALELELRLRSDPGVQRRKSLYEACVSRAKKHGASIGKDAMIAKLLERSPTYIVSLLETEDERFGPGALAERYARTFYKDFREAEGEG